jgi:hypothetical protein
MKPCARHLILVIILATVFVGCKEGFHRDEQARPRGSGIETARYTDGSVKARTTFTDGVPIETVYYRPDGTIVETVRYKDGIGVGLLLDDRGNIVGRGTLKNERFEGAVTRYKDGSPTKVVLYKNGVVVGEEPIPIATTKSDA